MVRKRKVVAVRKSNSFSSEKLLILFISRMFIFQICEYRELLAPVFDFLLVISDTFNNGDDKTGVTILGYKKNRQMYVCFDLQNFF